MIVTLSPARLMNFEANDSINTHTMPQFETEAHQLIDLLRDMTIEDLALLMDVNPKLAFSAYGQIQAFDHPKTPLKQAGFAYNGMAYLGLDIKSLSSSDLEYAQDHLLLLSGLYGALRPLDLIRPYRLEMLTKLENSRGADLYSFWRDVLTQHLLKCLNGDNKIWLNLMSGEFTKVIDRKRLPKDVEVIMPSFKEQTSQGYRQVIVHTKKARGMMARFVIKNRVQTTEHLKTFDDEGYAFSPELSRKGDFVFVR